jgi:hypothetical protein
MSNVGAAALTSGAVVGVDELGGGALGLAEHPAIIKAALAPKVAT